MSDTEKPKLRQANDNLWYCLATLYGEQPKGALPWNCDIDLAAKNRMAWNRWMAGVLSNEQRADLVGNGFPQPELVPLTPNEKSAFCSIFASRMGRSKEAPPDPAGGADFAHTNFDVFVFFDGFLFAVGADFNSATFSGYADFGSATFSRHADFGSATFSGVADFSSATFSGYAYFGLATFSGPANFRAATFSQRLSISDVLRICRLRLGDVLREYKLHKCRVQGEFYFRRRMFQNRRAGFPGGDNA